MKLKVSGDKELILAIRQIASDIDKELSSITLNSVQPIVDAARAKAPVQTGNLRDSISAEVVEQGPMRVTVEVGPSAEYADDVEFGGLHRAAKPFLRPAIDESQEKVVAILVTELNKVVG